MVNDIFKDAHDRMFKVINSLGYKFNKKKIFHDL